MQKNRIMWNDTLLQKLFTLIFLAILLLSYSPPSIASENKPPSVGSLLPAMNLITPKNVSLQKYLGLKPGPRFVLSDIKADIILIEIFSMYCPHCQKDASGINHFYGLINNDESLKNTIKMVGIGAGNSAFEVDVFRKRYKVPFPLFSDGDFIIHKLIGEVRTPYFIGIYNSGNNAGRVFFSQLGGFRNAEDFLKKILEASSDK